MAHMCMRPSNVQYATSTWARGILMFLLLIFTVDASRLLTLTRGDGASGRHLLGKQVARSPPPAKAPKALSPSPPSPSPPPSPRPRPASPSPTPTPKPSPSPSPSPKPSPSPVPQPQPTGGSGIPLAGGRCPDTQATFDTTNAYRTAHGARVLQWDATLAAASQAYAELLAGQACALKHADQSSLSAANRFGENLFMSSGYPNVTYTCKGAVDSWYSEVAKYRFTSKPYTDNFLGGTAVVGHFTQLVWNGTSTVGCGFATATVPFSGFGMGACKVVVCRYKAPGNVVGPTFAASDVTFSKNVLPKL